MVKLDIFLLGRFRAVWNNEPVAGLGNQKVQELLSYLVINPNQYHHRDKLANVLWEEYHPDSNGRKYLRKALWKLQTVFSKQQELANIIAYILNNPVKAVLVAVWTDWKFSYVHPDLGE